MIPLSVEGIARFSLDRLSVEPWSNGGGVTRPVASREMDGKVLWRISAADITRDGPFSRFDGLDREAVLIDGGCVRLQGDKAVLTMSRVGDRVRFAGEAAVDAELERPFSQLWNVMTARSYASSEIVVSGNSHESFDHVHEGALLILAGTAEAFLQDRHWATLSQGDGLVFDGWDGMLSLRFRDGPCHWLLTRINA